MTEPFDTLMRLQRHDTTLDQLRQRRRTLPEQAELDAVGEQRAQLLQEREAIQGRVDELAALQQALEGQIATVARRRHEIEQRMLTGEVTASRDLQAMDTEVHHLADHQAELEERELELVEEEEPADLALAENHRMEAVLVARAEQLRVMVAEAIASIDETAAAEAADRTEAAALLPVDLTERYERLRSHLGGVGAARLIGDRCDGCHLTLPSKEVERVRRLPPDQIATCEQCGRILVH